MNEYISVRLSNLFRHCSVGAIIRGPDALMTIKDIREWTDRRGNISGNPLHYVERVRAALEITEELREPPLAKMTDKGVDGVCIPAIRFPSWMRCPECGLLYFKPWINNPELKCAETKCNHRKLEQISWVLVHREGFMDDVDWNTLTHYGKPQYEQCRKDNQGKHLYLIRDQNDSTKWILSCRNKKCNANKQFSIHIGEIIKYMMKQPWLKERVKLHDPPIIMEINDTRIHYPKTRCAIVIPPESRINKGTVLDRLYCNSEKCKQIEKSKQGIDKQGKIRAIATEFKCTPKEIEDAWEEIQKGYPMYGQSLNITPGQIFEDEYRALIEPIPNLADSEDFVTRHYGNEWKKLGNQFEKGAKEKKMINIIDRLVAITRLKVILVFEGFGRVEYPPIKIVKPDIAGDSGWLPAMELYGEGIFISFDEFILQNWEKHESVSARAEVAKVRYQNVKTPFDVEVTPRFLLLHTLSHILIRQLESEAGYPAASIAERIYCSANEEFPMAGILLNVAVADVAGSLGGIAEIAEPKRFLKLISKAFDRADWCSLDPVCSEHEGQGPNLLNRAACHACALIPETSCTFGNILLDRTFLKGNSESGIPSLLDYAEISRQG